MNIARGVIEEIQMECPVRRDRACGFTYVHGEFPMPDFRYRPSNPDLIRSTDPRHYYLKDVFVMVSATWHVYAFDKSANSFTLPLCSPFRPGHRCRVPGCLPSRRSPLSQLQNRYSCYERGVCFRGLLFSSRCARDFPHSCDTVGSQVIHLEKLWTLMT